MKENKDFWVQCNVCKTQIKNHVGSTPCCGSIAYIMDGINPTKTIVLYGKQANNSMGPVIIGPKPKFLP